MIDISVRRNLPGHIIAAELEVPDGSFTGIYGKSGIGKTTFLKMLAGIEIPDEGWIKVGNIFWWDKCRKIHLVPQRRETGLVFQSYALFPNMTVRQNLEFAANNKNAASWISEIMERMQLATLSAALPASLSGGQQQRVALARALVRRPRVLLLDEPLSALDQEMRAMLLREIRNLHNTYNLTTIMVSHDVEELAEVSDEVYEMQPGRLVKKNFAFENAELEPQFLKLEDKEDLLLLEILIGNRIQKIPIPKNEFIKFWEGRNDT